MLNVLVDMLGRVSKRGELLNEMVCEVRDFQPSKSNRARGHDSQVSLPKVDTRDSTLKKSRCEQTDLSQSSGSLGPSLATTKSTLPLTFLNHNFSS